jgi:cell division protein FtsN
VRHRRLGGGRGVERLIMDDLVTVAAFADVSQAELARERLELEGITAFVIDGQSAGIMPYLTSATGGVRVQVGPMDSDRAREILFG